MKAIQPSVSRRVSVSEDQGKSINPKPSKAAVSAFGPAPKLGTLLGAHTPCLQLDAPRTIGVKAPGRGGLSPWYLAVRGNGETVYHPNGRVLTYSAGREGATWYHANGRVATYSAMSSGATTYYANGQVMSYSTGSVGATWYHENGRVMSYSAGSAGATWYYDNGQVMTYNGPSLSERELWGMAVQAFAGGCCD